LVILVPLFAPEKTRKPAPDKGFMYIECSGATKHNSTSLPQIDWLSVRELSRTAEIEEITGLEFYVMGLKGLFKRRNLNARMFHAKGSHFSCG
jgi:hypothetical protein